MKHAPGVDSATHRAQAPRVPEGDTVLRAAARLRAALLDEPIVRFEANDPTLTRERVGHRVVDVRARGKNLLFAFDDGWLLHSHLLMSGSWHVYRAGERWQRPRERMRVALHTARSVAVGFDLPVARFVRDVRAVPTLARLGPDLLAGGSIDEVVLRLRANAALPVGVALLRQSLVAGIGNVYKSEVLFLERVSPFVRLDALDDERLRAILERARTWLGRNLDGRPRRTRLGEGGRHWVYRRGGEPCFVCGTPVRMRRQGEEARSTYFCPECQSVAER